MLSQSIDVVIDGKDSAQFQVLISKLQCCSCSAEQDIGRAITDDCEEEWSALLCIMVCEL